MCHQTVSLVSRRLEAAGIPTVVVGSARDIVEECGVARFVFVDFPLGNPCGKPDDTEMQGQIVSLALDVVESAIVPRTTVQAPFQWHNTTWRAGFMPVTDENRAELKRVGDLRKAKQAAAAAAQ